jgi:histone H3/H4
MGYDWYDGVDRLVWFLEECIERGASAHASIQGMAPSAGDEARARLRAIASSVAPLQLVEDSADLVESDVRALTESIAAAAVDAASDRGSRHVTREDMSTAIDAVGAYPYRSRH